MNKKLHLILISLFLFIFQLSFHWIPYFWDNIRTSQIANYYLNSGFSNLFIPLHFDSGNPPFYGLYTAFVWFVFGKSLLVSHLAILPFSITLFFQFFLLLRKYFTNSLSYFGLFLLAIEPTFLTQHLLIGWDIVICCCFIFVLNAIIENHSIGYLTLFLIILLFTNLRGLALYLVLFVFNWYYNRNSIFKQTFKNLFLWIAPIILFLVWLFIHYLQTHTIVSGGGSSWARQFVSFHAMGRNLIFVLWKIFDFGRIIFLFLLFFLFIYFVKKKIFFHQKQIQKLFIFLPILFIGITFQIIPFSNTISHRYFMPMFILFIYFSVYFISILHKQNMQIFVVIMLTLNTIVGSFWIYPIRFGNGWDASVKVLPYFSLTNELFLFLQNNPFPQNALYAKFPLEDNFYYSDLKHDIQFTSVENIVKTHPKFLVYSNINNNYNGEELQFLSANYSQIKQFSAGLVYIEIVEYKLN